MAYPWSVYKTWTTGEVLTAADLNNSFAAVISNAVPANIDDYSVNSTAMQTTTDPYPAAAESLATSLAGEIERLRYVIAQITGESNWYVDPDGTLAQVFTSSATFAGAKTFSSAVTISPTTNQIVLGDTNTTTISATAPSASRVVTIPDPGGAASFVMTEGTQTINGAKTFSSTIATSGITNTAGVDIQGTNTNDNAAAGFVGEYTESIISVGQNAPTTDQYGDLTSISLTAGDWDVWGMVAWDQNGATWTTQRTGISVTTGNSSTGLTAGDNVVLDGNASSSTTPTFVSQHATWRVSLNATTTIYLKYRAAYSVGTPKAQGGIKARRVR